MAEFGPISIRIGGTGHVVRLVIEELGPNSAGPAGFDISFGPVRTRSAAVSSIKGSHFELAHRVSRIDTGIRLEQKLRQGSTLFALDLELGPDGTPTAATVGLPIAESWLARVLAPLTVLGSRDGSTVAQIAAKNAIYDLVDPITQLLLLPLGASFLHASGVVYEGQAVAFTGAGGVGKSTSLIGLMTAHPDLSYLSDDLMVLDPAGIAHRHPKRVQIYGYNVQGLPEVGKHIRRGLTPLRQVIWHVRAAGLGQHSVRRRMSPADVFGSTRVSAEAPLKKLLWLTPTAGANVETREIGTEIMAARCAAALMEEMWDFFRLWNLGFLLDDRIMTVGGIQGRTREAIQSALRSVECIEVSVPAGSTPATLVPTLSKIIAVG